MKRKKPKITTIPILKHFESLKDPRQQHKIDHKMIDIIGISFFAVISNSNSWSEIEEYGKAKIDFLKKYFELPNGIPSHDAFRYFFIHLNPIEFEKCFLKWIKSLKLNIKGKLVAIDGKTLCNSFNSKTNKKAIHMMSAFASELNIVIGQLKTEEKSNEITAIPDLLDLLEINGAIISIDAMGCQKKIAQKILDKKADYLLAVKENQKKLYASIKDFFEKPSSKELINFDCYEENETFTHGRSEKRIFSTYTIEKNIKNYGVFTQWPKLIQIGKVESIRLLNGKLSNENRYYILSKSLKAKDFGNATRNHWGIENKHHWILDVTFNEDKCRKRIGHSDENFSKIRALALNILKSDKTSKKSIKLKRFIAAMDNTYLEKLLMNFFHA